MSDPGAKLKVAFVGCGNIAKYHLAAAHKTGRVAVTVLVDPNPEGRAMLLAELERLRAAAGSGEHGSADADADSSAPAPPLEFSSLQEAIDADPNQELFTAVDIMVPSFVVGGQDLHDVVATTAINGHRHVLLEKPVCIHPATAERLRQHHKEVAPECVLAVAENAQFWPEVLAAKAAIDRGEIGQVLSARAKAWESATGEWAGDYAEGSWRCDDSKLPAASFTFDSASHWIRPLRMWLGKPTGVVGTAGKALPRMAGVSMSQHIITFDSGTSAIFETMLAPEGISEQAMFAIQGTLGEIVCSGYGGGCSVNTVVGGAQVSREVCKEGWDASYAAEYVDFVEAVLDGKATKGPIGEAIADLKVCHALLTSAESRTWVQLDL